MAEKNRGFTLLELVIAIAISSLIVGSVAAFLCSSTSHYRRTKEEISLQMEAQLILNQLDNLMMEAENVKFDAASKTLKVKHGDVLYVITLDSSTHTLLFEKVPGGGSETGNSKLFGRYVEDLEVTDTGTGDNNNRIVISLQLKSDDQTYTIPGNVILLRNKIRAMDSW